MEPGLEQESTSRQPQKTNQPVSNQHYNGKSQHVNPSLCPCTVREARIVLSVGRMPSCKQTKSNFMNIKRVLLLWQYKVLYVINKYISKGNLD